MPQPHWHFQIRGEGTEALELDIYDAIGEGFLWRGITARDVRAKLKAAPQVKTIKVRINSRGGDVLDGTAIYNLLAEHGARVEVDIDGVAASMASVIAMAGDEIRMASTAYLMIHNPWGVGIGEADDLRQLADVLDKMREQLADAYVARTNLKRSEVLAMMDAETWMTGKEAKEKGFVDKVMPAKKKAQASALAAFALADLDDYRNLPDDIRSFVDGAHARDEEEIGQLALKTPPAEGRNKEEHDMTISKLILAALCLSDTADESAAVAAVKRLRERDGLCTKLEAATGKQGDEALGVTRAWKESHDKLAAVEKDLAETRARAERTELDAIIKQGRDEKKLTKAEADKLESQVKAHWAAKAEGKEPEGDAMSLAAAKSFVAAMSPKAHLSGDTAGSSPAPAALEWKGKRYADLKPAQRAQCKREEPELYEAMKRDHDSKS